jgi:hypothetical protein
LICCHSESSHARSPHSHFHCVSDPTGHQSHMRAHYGFCVPEIALINRFTLNIWRTEENQSGPRLSPGGLQSRQPRRGGRKGGNSGGGQQREMVQAAVHQTSSKHTFTSRHGRISNRSPNQKDIAGKNRAHNSRNRLGTSGYTLRNGEGRISQRTLDHDNVKDAQLRSLK